MNKTFVVTLFMVCSVLILASCSKQNDGSKTIDKLEVKKNDVGELKFTNKVLYKSYNGCVPETENCTYIKLEYIEATGGIYKDKINAIINNELLHAYDMPDKSYQNTDEMMSDFLRDYETFRKEVPSAPQAWAISLKIKVQGETEKVLSVGEELISYLGGAHPNAFSLYFNVDKSSGEVVKLTDLLIPGFETKLNALIDKKYREGKNLKPGDNLAEKGDLFENGIKFNYNFIVTKDKGLDFFYNPYEIAPYAVGPIKISISRAELEDIIAPTSAIK